MRETDISRRDVINNLNQYAMDRSDRIGQACAVAASMLSEQDPVLAFDIHKLAGVRCGKCPECGAYLNTEVNPNYCGVCGRAVKWN